jgi:uncharacterized glyoxalase superfamily protein PhnB
MPTNATIVSPVSRHIVVADMAGSRAFYCNVLGFADGKATPESGIDAVVELGAARIHFHTQEDAVDSTGPLRLRGKAILFFETDDVHAIYSKLKERGAHPTELEKVNWIKMELFEVSDPDGHRLWFGQSYHKENDKHIPEGRGQLRQIMPVFPCNDVPAAVIYYCNVFGFTVNYQQQDLGVIDRDEIRLLLVTRNEQNPGTASCCIYIKDADQLYAELKAKGALLLKEPVSHPWGLRDFEAQDTEGNRINFAQPFE